MPSASVLNKMGAWADMGSFRWRVRNEKRNDQDTRQAGNARNAFAAPGSRYVSRTVVS